VSLSQEVRNYILANIDVGFSLDPYTKTKRGMQHLFSIKPPCKLQAEYEHVLSTALIAEKTCPGAGKLFLKLVCCEEIKDAEVLCKSRKDVKEVLTAARFSKDVLQMLFSIVDMSSSTSNISIRKSERQSYIELTEGYNFNSIPQVKTPPTLLGSCKVACIDGYVENVSELHHLFTSLSENKTPCLLFVRGFSEEVVHTIKVNNDRKTMLVFPFVVPYDLESVNVLVDLAIVSGCDVISSTKGQLISSLNYSQLGHVQSCLVNDGNIKLINSTAKKRVAEHIINLKQKLSERQEIGEFLVKRIKSLSSKNIEVGIPDGVNYFSTYQQLDEGIRMITSMLKNDYKPVRYAKLFFDSFENHSSNMRYHLL